MTMERVLFGCFEEYLELNLIGKRMVVFIIFFISLSLQLHLQCFAAINLYALILEYEFLFLQCFRCPLLQTQTSEKCHQAF